MKNAKLQHVDMTASRTELHELLSLTGTEVSINNLPAGVSIPFVHAHTNNEELYIFCQERDPFSSTVMNSLFLKETVCE